MTVVSTTLTAGQDLVALRAWVNALPAFAASGVTCLEMEAGFVRAEMQLPETVRNPSGAVNGGALSYFADQVGGAVASTLVPVERGPVTTTLTVNYLAAARGEQLHGTARVGRAGRTLAFVEIQIHDSERLCLTGSGVWLLTPSR